MTLGGAPIVCRWRRSMASARPHAVASRAVAAERRTAARLWMAATDVPLLRLRRVNSAAAAAAAIWLAGRDPARGRQQRAGAAAAAATAAAVATRTGAGNPCPSHQRHAAPAWPSTRRFAAAL